MNEFLSGIYGKITEKGQATAYRFIASLDGTIIGIHFQDFVTDNDYVDDSDLEDLSEDLWRDGLADESRCDECFDVISEYIKTTDQPEEMFGVPYSDLAPWGQRFVDCL